MKNIAVILAGCGFKDGSEITEAVSVLISITQAGARYQCFAPDLTVSSFNLIKAAFNGERSLLAEAARICRGDIKPLEDLSVHDFDALFFPGGFGAANHLSEWAQLGCRGKVLPAVEKNILDFYHEQKPIGACCVAPVLLAQVLGSEEITLTIGDDCETASEIEKTGALHQDCAVDDFVTDRAHRIITCPAYMYDEATSYQVFTGIQKAIQELVEMA